MKYFVDDLHVLALYFEADSVQWICMVSAIKPAEAREAKAPQICGIDS